MNVDRIIGAERVIERFGEWPSFHDAEVVRVTLDRRGPSAAVLVHTWLMTEQVDEKGYYVLERHTLVQLIFDQLTSCELSDFNHQNVLYSLNIAAEAVDGPASSE
jgi:hypothetical protein